MKVGTDTAPSQGRRLGWCLRIAFFVLLVLAWQGLAKQTESLLVPSFGETIAALAALLFTTQLWSALWISNQAMLLGFALATVVGVGIGLLIGRWPAAEKVVDPYLSILLVTPMSAVIPIVVMAAGLGLPSRVIVVFTFSLTTIIVNTRAGLHSIQPVWIEMARGFGATEVQLWRRVLLRGAGPAILMGLRLGLIRAVSGMVTVELLLIAVGIGRLILDFQAILDVADMYATVIVIIAEAVLITRLCQVLEQRASPWASSTGPK